MWVPFPGENAIDGDVFEPTPTSIRPTVHTFELHAQLLHDAPGCGISSEVTSLDTVETKRRESKLCHSAGSLSCEPIPPMGRADPVSELPASVAA